MSANYFYLPKAFINPNNTPKPKGEALKDDTYFPEMNSQTYLYACKSNYRPPSDFLPFFCHLDSLEDFFVLGTNNFNKFVFDGSLIATKSFETIVNHNIDEAMFQTAEKASITALKFLDSEYVSIYFSFLVFYNFVFLLFACSA